MISLSYFTEAKLRDANPELGYDLSCLWTHCRDEIEKSLPGPLWQKVDANFLKGGYDRELSQHVKAQDPNFTVADLHFLEVLKGETTNVKSLAQQEMEAAETLESATFNKFSVALKKEQQLWSEHCAAVKSFEARTKASRLDFNREQEADFHKAAGSFIESWLPVNTPESAFLTTAIQNTVGQFAVRSGVVDEQVYQILLVDMTKLGSAYSKYQGKCIATLSENIASNPTKSIGVVLAPNTAHWGSVYSESKIADNIKALEEALKERVECLLLEYLL